MNNITENLKTVLVNNKSSSRAISDRQSAYYKRLVEKGIAKKETYKLKSVSAI